MTEYIWTVTTKNHFNEWNVIEVGEIKISLQCIAIEELKQAIKWDVDYLLIEVWWIKRS